MEVVNLDHPMHFTVSLNSEPCVMALGFFDGVHKGHRKIIETAKGIAQKEKIKFTVMTFFPHPSNVISKEKKIEHYITPISVKKEIFKNMGVEKLYIVNFNTDFSKFSHKQFVEQYIVALKCQHVVAGFDFTYGYKGQGNMEQLVADSNGRFNVTTVSKMEYNHEKISSTMIREMLNAGNVKNLPMYLEDYYSIKGEVIRHYPLNNNETVITITIDHSYRLPKKGEYKIKIELNRNIFYGIVDVPIQNTGTINIYLLNSQINYENDNELTFYFLDQEEAVKPQNSRSEEDEKITIII
jgi:riboflavin kinase / FMN adenylyltransferase